MRPVCAAPKPLRRPQDPACFAYAYTIGHDSWNLAVLPAV